MTKQNVPVSVNLESYNAASYYLYHEFFHYYILIYKIAEFDVLGAKAAEQWDVAVEALKNSLFYAMSIYIYTKNISPSQTSYILLAQLKATLNDSKLYQIVENLYYSNPITQEEVETELAVTQYLIENFLIPPEVWTIWGKGKQFNFSAYLDTVLNIKDIGDKMEADRKNNTNTHDRETVLRSQELLLKVTKGK